jgi:ribosomal-protein-alanine N-acetyltransferase
MPISSAKTPTICAADASDRSLTETKRLLLRQVTNADLPMLLELLGNLDVMRFSVTGPLVPLQVVQVLSKILQSYHDAPLALWGVVEKAERRLIGLCGFLPRNIRKCVEWELAYRFLPAVWGQGLATEATIACRELAFRQRHVNQIIALIEPANVASIRVAEKTGLVFRESLQLESLPVLKYVLTRQERLIEGR